MWIWAVMIVSGICTFMSFYTAFLALKVGDSGAFLFLAFGLFSGIFFVISFMKIAAGKSAWIKRADERLSGEPRRIQFVPHWFIMLMLVAAGIGILASILVPFIF